MKITRCIWLLCAAALTVAGGCQRQDQDKTEAAKKSEAPATPPPKVIVETAPASDAAPTPAPATPPAAVAAAPQPDPLVTQAQAKAAAIESQSSSLDRREGQWTLGSATIGYSVLMSGPAVSYIEEHVDAGDAGNSVNKYYFEDGALFFYQDEGRWRETNPPNPMSMRQIGRAMVIDAQGRLVTAYKTVDGVSVGLGENEVTAVLAQAWHLLAATNKQGPSPKAAKGEKAAAEPRAAADSDKAATGKETAADGQRVTFEAGANSTRIKNKVSGAETREYRVRGKAGQLLTLKLASDGAAVFGVFSNRGEIVADLTAWSGKLPRDGDYRIRIGLPQGRREGAAEFTLDIALQ